MPLANRVAKLRLSMLNEEIKEAFRTKAYLRRCLDRSADILKEIYADWIWLHEQSRLTFVDELRLTQERLLKKVEKPVCTARQITSEFG